MTPTTPLWYSEADACGMYAQEQLAQRLAAEQQRINDAATAEMLARLEIDIQDLLDYDARQTQEDARY